MKRRRSTSSATTEWSRIDRWVAVGAAASYVALGLSFRDDPGPGEMQLFRALNHDGRPRHALRVPQQLGTPWVLPGLALTGFLTHRPHLALAATCALPLEKVLEVGLKKFLDRNRPSQVDPRVRLRDDAPVEGPSYPSGHAAIAFAAVYLGRSYLRREVVAAGATMAAVTALVRVHQGAHFPADTVGGALLGVAAAATARTVFGRPGRA